MTNITLEMVDELIAKTGATYEEAKKILQETDGNIEAATIKLLDKKDDSPFDAGKIDDVVAKLKDTFAKGAAARLVVKKDDNVVLNIPAAVGLLGLIKPFLGAAGIGAAVLTGHEIVIENKDGSEVNVNEMIEKATSKAKEAGNDLMDKLKEAKADAEEKFDEFADKAKDFGQDVKDVGEEVKDDVVGFSAEVKDETQDFVEEVKDDVEKL